MLINRNELFKLTLLGWPNRMQVSFDLFIHIFYLFKQYFKGTEFGKREPGTSVSIQKI